MKSINQEIISVLESIPLFRGIDRQDIVNMLGCLNPRMSSYQKNQPIASIGDPFLGLGIILEGEVIVAKENIAGNRMIITVLKKGDMFGEMMSFSMHTTWIAAVTAQTQSQIIFISPEKVISQCEKMCSGHKKLIENILAIMAKKALLLNRKVEYLTIKTLRGKLCAYLLETQKRTQDVFFELPMNRDEMADFFNVARPSISRELSKMREDGWIDFHKSTFKILNVDQLKNYIE
ncbi:Crp/Fnr family transcriptional regulator [Fusibacter ferrireducens]|uniref:Crp/Fnr family transcriptional regulator n=1 Tax=Fusibacter ferrireducens TaxID=2785058 RepID=A0ABR9ZQM1_9FIRM|nr:Crp/Fnr family transcriptional regulator [Fusibacter ferrireducens]MBF4692743.1 Crp/Fnr family transcriptional regulator [Fusibacter ferrireducens]